MNEPTHIKPDQSIILGNHVACDGKASKKMASPSGCKPLPW